MGASQWVRKHYAVREDLASGGPFSFRIARNTSRTGGAGYEMSDMDFRSSGRAPVNTTADGKIDSAGPRALHRLIGYCAYRKYRTE